MLGIPQRRALSAIALCRTAALGGHVDLCRSCGHERPAYNSCRNRHCPKCQAMAQEEWIRARAQRLLPVRHFHVVFTLPCELRPLAQAFPRLVFDALFRCAGETLLELARTRLGGDLGATMVLHTWTRDLRFHPHVHAIVTAGALSEMGWTHAGRKYLFPVQVMGKLLRGKMLDALRHLLASGELGAGAAAEQQIRKAARHDWVVYAKSPFHRAGHVLAYLGRYTHRVGISNSRLLEVTDDHVTFRTRGRKTTTLTPVEFLRRFVSHVLPHRFVKIRHYGLYAGTNALTKLPVALEALGRVRTTSSTVATAAPLEVQTWQERLRTLTGHDVRACPNCGGPVVSVPVPRASSRDPPGARLSA